MNTGCCIHHNSSWHNKTCEAGVNYRQLVGGPDFGWMARLPCTRANVNHTGPTCEKYQEPTDEQVAESDREMQAAIDQLVILDPTLEKVKRDHKGKDWTGFVTCPCCGSNLYLSHAAYNGHVHGKCETDGCVNFME